MDHESHMGRPGIWLNLSCLCVRVGMNLNQYIGSMCGIVGWACWGGFPNFFRKYCASGSGLVGHVLSVCEWQSFSCGVSINSDHDKHHQKKEPKTRLF